jgi:hypothetical protein
VKSFSAPKPLHLTPAYITSDLSATMQQGGRQKSSSGSSLRTNKTISIRQYLARAEKLKNP